LEETMFWLATFVALQIAFLSVAFEPTRAAEYGTAEAKAMLERAVAAVKEDKAKALDMFSKGEGGFKETPLARVSFVIWPGHGRCPPQLIVRC
jgi:hypothetical protein